MGPLRYTIVPGKTTKLTVQTTPNVACILYHDDPDKHLKLFADGDGVITMHLHPHQSSQGVGVFTIASDGGKHSLELRTAQEESAEYPFHVANVERKGAAKIRPALTYEEAVTLDNEELVKRGYSPRPPLGSEGRVPELWLKAVQTPLTVVKHTRSKRRAFVLGLETRFMSWFRRTILPVARLLTMIPRYLKL